MERLQAELWASVIDRRRFTPAKKKRSSFVLFLAGFMVGCLLTAIMKI